ncbi:MAG: outer membrane lipoprotein-sorting protein, partial [Proteobacteria bacterium]|nr:outer membrane lipoprotein-sorting protein [Pseudomonadota bacterium]
MLKTIAVFVSLLFVSPAFAIDANLLLEQVDRNLNPDSYEMYRKLINI